MEAFNVVIGKVAPMLAANIDTDVIMPKQFLKGIDRKGLIEAYFLISDSWSQVISILILCLTELHGGEQNSLLLDQILVVAPVVNTPYGG